MQCTADVGVLQCTADVGVLQCTADVGVLQCTARISGHDIQQTPDNAVWKGHSRKKS